MSTVENADIIRAAVEAQELHPHELNPFNDCCSFCGRTAREIFDRPVPCDKLINHKPRVLPWGDR